MEPVQTEETGIFAGEAMEAPDGEILGTDDS